jgi:hypothetical protein
VTTDNHQKIVEVVGDTTGELSQGIHSLCMSPLALCLLQLQLAVAALGNVARNLGKPD